MNLTKGNNSTKIRRRSFFLYLGASVFGIFSLSKLPFNLFKSRLNNELKRGQKLSVKANPYAVKRTSGGAKNG